MANAFCPCYRCRPPGMTLAAALRVSTHMGEIRAYGRDGAEQREAEKQQRLRELESRRKEQ